MKTLLIIQPDVLKDSVGSARKSLSTARMAVAQGRTGDALDAIEEIAASLWKANVVIEEGKPDTE